jgi:hypothetical protein
MRLVCQSFILEIQKYTVSQSAERQKEKMRAIEKEGMVIGLKQSKKRRKKESTHLGAEQGRTEEAP